MRKYIKLKHTLSCVCLSMFVDSCSHCCYSQRKLQGVSITSRTLMRVFTHQQMMIETCISPASLWYVVFHIQWEVSVPELKEFILSDALCFRNINFRCDIREKQVKWCSCQAFLLSYFSCKMTHYPISRLPTNNYHTIA